MHRENFAQNHDRKRVTSISHLQAEGEKERRECPQRLLEGNRTRQGNYQ